MGDCMKQICKEHGEYEAQEHIIKIKGKPKDSFTITTKCPKCAAIQEQEEQEEENKNLMQHLESMGVSRRFIDCTLDNYKTVNEVQKVILNQCNEYLINFDKIQKSGSTLFFCGSVGTGKTHLAVSILKSLYIDQHIRGKYITVMQMLREIRNTYNRNSDKTEQQIIDKYINFPILVLDEVGVQLGTDNEKMLIFEIMDGRYQAVRPSIIISNLSIKNMETYLGERVIDRLRSDDGGLIVMDWKSYRITKG